MTTLANTAEGGANGVAVSTANSGGASGNAWDAVNAGGSGSITYDNAHAHSGTLAYKIVADAANNVIMTWDTSLSGSQTELWGRCYIYLTEVPANNIALVWLRTAANGNMGRVRIAGTTGVIDVTDASNTVVQAGTVAVAIGQWVRIEWHAIASTTAGTLTATLYNSADSTSASETVGASGTVALGAAVIDRVHYGRVAASSPPTFWLDDLGVSDAGPMGPAPTNVAAGRATTTGTARPVTAAKSATAARITGTGTARPVTTQQVHVAGRVTATSTVRPVATSTSASGMSLLPDLSIEAAFSTGSDTGGYLQLDDATRGRLGTGLLAPGGTGVPIWVDLTDRFTEGKGSISRGSQRVDSPVVTYEPGTATIPLDNHDRALDPSNLDGPWTRESGDLDGTATLLNTNTGFETAGPVGWAGYGGTLVRASDRVRSGSWAGKFTPSGTTSWPIVASDWAPMTPGQTYRASAWVQCDEAHTAHVEMHFYTGALAFISAASSVPVNLAADTWTFISVTGVAPAGAAWAPLVVSLAGTPLATNVLWVDEATLEHLPYGRVTQVTATKPVRVRATWAGVTYELFRGTADDWDVAWHDPGHSVTTLTATDAFKILAGIDRAALPAEVGAGETTSARVGRILDSAGWLEGDRSIGTGISTLQGTLLDGDTLTELQAVATSEIGELYIDGGGRVVFRGRHAALTDARSNTPQAVFGDADDELPYVTLGIASDDGTFFNHIRVTRRSSGEGDEPVEQVAEDATSQARYYKKTFPAGEVLVQTDAAAADYARYLLRVAATPEIRFTEITIEPAQQPAELWPHTLGRQIGDRITIRRRPPGGGAVIERDCFIRGIRHDFGDEEWTTTWTLQDADRTGSFLVLDNPEQGRLDANALGF